MQTRAWTGAPWALRGVALAALLWAAGCDGGDDNARPGDGGRADGSEAGGGDGAPPLAACTWDKQPQELPSAGGKVKGVLRGTSRNTSTTCTRQRGTGGPEAIYVLTVRDRTLVDLEVRSSIDTVLAVRRVCDDPLTELACNDTPVTASDPSEPPPPGMPGGPTPPGVPTPPPPPGFPVADAGAAPPPPASRDAHLRAALDAGSYYVIVDEAEPFGVGGSFELELRFASPPAQSSCLSALPVTDGTSLAAEELDLASEPSPSCAAAASRPALYYTATIPSGQRLTARPTPTRGDRSWVPVVQLISACGQQPMCLATDRQAADGSRVLRYVNNGPSEQKVFMSVAASSPVQGDYFRLDVNIGEPILNSTCASARPLSDGQVLRGQDLAEGQLSMNFQCMRGSSPSLFYSATLLDRQTLKVTLASRSPGAPFGALVIMRHEACGTNLCQAFPADNFSYTNPGPSTRTVIIEVTSFAGPQVFDMMVSMPLPAGGVIVTPTAGLATGEAGDTASFDVALSAVPREPVVIPLSSSNPKEGTVSPTSLRFETSNWQQPQRVTVTGVDDADRDGSRAYSIRLEPAMSKDPRYAGLDAPDVMLVNRDDEAGLGVEGAGAAGNPLHTSESGATARFTVTLSRMPTATVRLPVKVSDDSEARASPAELVFEPADWNVAQSVTVTGLDDPDRDGTQNYKVLIGPAASADAQYAGLAPVELEGRNADNEFERVAAQMVSGNLSCPNLFEGMGQRIGVDEAGNLYAVMMCFGTGSGRAPDAGSGGGSAPAPMPPIPVDAGPPPIDPASPQVFVAVSSDGGRTWKPPVSIGLNANHANVVGASGGTAVVVGSGLQGTMLVRSEDGGATWQAPRALSLVQSEVRLAAAGRRVAVAGGADDGPTLWYSADSGRAFRRAKAPDVNSLVGLAVEADSDTVWAARFDGFLVVHKSTDGGQSFDGGSSVSPDFSTGRVAFGSKMLFAVGPQSRLLAVPLQTLNMPRFVNGLAAQMVRFIPVLVADASDNVTVLEDVAGSLEVHRLPSGSDSFLPSKSLGFSEETPGAVPLSDKAIAIALVRKDQLWVAVETW